MPARLRRNFARSSEITSRGFWLLVFRPKRRLRFWGSARRLFVASESVTISASYRALVSPHGSDVFRAWSLTIAQLVPRCYERIYRGCPIAVGQLRLRLLYQGIVLRIAGSGGRYRRTEHAETEQGNPEAQTQTDRVP